MLLLVRVCMILNRLLPASPISGPLTQLTVLHTGMAFITSGALLTSRRWNRCAPFEPERLTTVLVLKLLVTPIPPYLLVVLVPLFETFRPMPIPADRFLLILKVCTFPPTRMTPVGTVTWLLVMCLWTHLGL